MVAGAALEGSYVHMFGGAVWAFALVLGLVWIRARGAHPLPRRARVGVALLALTLLWQVLPLPNGVRAVLAPGQAAWTDKVAPEWRGDLDGWLTAVAKFDVLASIDVGTWDQDVLAGAHASTVRIGAIDGDAFAWTLGHLLAMAVVWTVGRGLARSHDATRIVMVGTLLLAVAEAFFGLANRSGGTTGIGVKQFYLGSATGSFINRGDFAALLVLGVGAAWGLAAAMFPLVSDEIRAHRSRKSRSSQPPSVWEASGDRLPRLGLIAFFVAVMLVSAVAAQSRGPLLSLMVSALLIGGWMAWRRKETFHLWIALAVPVVGVALGALGFGVRGAFGRFSNVLTGGDGSLNARIQTWTDSVPAWLDSPVFGAGLGGWRLAHGLHEVRDHLFATTHAHLEPLELLVETGVVGVLGFAILAWAVAREFAPALRAPVEEGTNFHALRADPRGEEMRAGLAAPAESPEAGVPHDDRAAAGVGALVATLAIALQCLGDFPLRVPGIALPWALWLGLASGLLVRREEPPPSARRTYMWLGAAVVALGLVGTAALADARFSGSRAERLAEQGKIWFVPGAEARTVEEKAAWGALAASGVASRPLDPWAHAAVASAEATLAFAGWRTGGSRAVGDAPEDHAYTADLSIARAQALRPRDPRLSISLARSLLLLATHAPGGGDGFRERATVLLADAVLRDPWRAEDAFEVAGALPEAKLQRVVDAVDAEPRVRARVVYQLGKTLEGRGAKDAAARQYLAAIAIDPKYAPASFAAGILARKDEAAARVHFERFMTGDERPGGMEGWALVFLGDYDRAEARFRKVVSETPTNRWAWEGLAEVGKRKGRTEDERAALTRILAIDPSHPTAKARLAELAKKR